MVVTFLAVLELIRLKIIQAVQTENFGEIEIVRAPEPLPNATEPEGEPPTEMSPAATPRPSAGEGGAEGASPAKEETAEEQ